MKNLFICIVCLLFMNEPKGVKIPYRGQYVCCLERRLKTSLKMYTENFDFNHSPQYIHNKKNATHRRQVSDYVLSSRLLELCTFNPSFLYT